MSKRLVVKVMWPNSDSPLIPDKQAVIELISDKGNLATRSRRSGERIFELPADVRQVTLKATFRTSFGEVPANPTTGREKVSAQVDKQVLQIEQTYDVQGMQLTARSIAAFGEPNPLVVTKGAANKNGVAVITLRTQFVDIGELWPHYADLWFEEFASHKQADDPVSLHLLGYTGGMPIVWLASVPKGLSSYGGKEPGALVFFRPGTDYEYSRLDQHHVATNAVQRYLLSPVDDSVPSLGAREVRPGERDHAGLTYFLRCSFEKALASSGRAIVMIHPWPSRSAFGAAATAQLPELCESVIRFLRWKGVACRGISSVRLGKLGLSGFSYGGAALWSALESNMARTTELYAFDCAEPGSSGRVVQWFNSKEEASLRLVGGAYNAANYEAIFASLHARTPRATASLSFARDVDFAKRSNVVWDHFLGPYEARRYPADQEKKTDRSVALGLRHQFSICGGTSTSATYSLDSVVTYLEGFLRQSTFAKA